MRDHHGWHPLCAAGPGPSWPHVHCSAGPPAWACPPCLSATHCPWHAAQRHIECQEQEASGARSTVGSVHMACCKNARQRSVARSDVLRLALSSSTQARKLSVARRASGASRRACCICVWKLPVAGSLVGCSAHSMLSHAHTQQAL